MLPGAGVGNAQGRVLHERREFRKLFHHNGAVANKEHGPAMDIDKVFPEHFLIRNAVKILQLFTDEFNILYSLDVAIGIALSAIIKGRRGACLETDTALRLGVWLMRKLQTGQCKRPARR